MKVRLRTNLCAGIVSIIAGALLFWIVPQQIGLDYGTTYGITSRTIPYAVAILWIVCGCVLLVQSLILKKETVKTLVLKDEAIVLGYMVVLVLYMMTFQKSFLIATSALGVISLAFMRVKKPLYYIIVVAAVVIIWALFTQMLHVSLP